MVVVFSLIFHEMAGTRHLVKNQTEHYHHYLSFTTQTLCWYNPLDSIQRLPESGWQRGGPLRF